MKEIVIKIDDKLYEQIFSTAEIIIVGDMRSGKTLLGTLLRAIHNGKVLPKGHGELKDTNEILAKTHAMQKDLESDNDRVWAINKPKYKALAYANRFIIDAPVLVKEDKEG